MRPLAVLRPEPGNAATAARIEAAGGRALRLPLFGLTPLAWTPPDPADHDALFLTSANAVRFAGAALASYYRLPVHVVGAATAAAARAAGLTIATTGDQDAATMADRAVGTGVARALHLAGRDRATAALAGTSCTIAVYASEPLPVTPADLLPLAGAVALIHSPRAGQRLAALMVDRVDVAIAVISPAAAAAVGTGWRALAVAAVPTDAALTAAGMTLAD